MVASATNFSRSGLSDFLLQRVSAVILGVYSVVVLAFFVTSTPMNHAELVGFFGGTSMQIFSTLAILATIAHAWIGMWTVGTDYLMPLQLGGSATTVRFAYQVGCLLLLFVYLFWAMKLVWSL